MFQAAHHPRPFTFTAGVLANELSFETIVGLDQEARCLGGDPF